MGNIAEGLLSGEFDSETGEYLGEPVGYPRTAADLKREAGMEENDIKAFGLYTKALREERNEKFEKNWLPKLQKVPDLMVVYDEKRYCWVIDLIGIKPIFLDYYPKANKVFNRTTKKWKKPGLKYLIETFIEPPKKREEREDSEGESMIQRELDNY